MKILSGKDEGLKRIIGVRTLALSAVNLTIGAGIFALPALVAAEIGASAFLAYLVCTGLLGLVSVSRIFSELTFLVRIYSAR